MLLTCVISLGVNTTLLSTLILFLRCYLLLKYLLMYFALLQSVHTSVLLSVAATKFGQNLCGQIIERYKSNQNYNTHCERNINLICLLTIV